MSFLIDRAIRGSVRISGAWTPGNGVDRVYDNPELEPGDEGPVELSILSLDIETDPRRDRLLSIALVGRSLRADVGEIEKVFVLVEDGGDVPRSAEPFATEKELLIAFADEVRRFDPDLVTGWNVVDFDLRDLTERASRHHVPLVIGRGPGRLRLRPLQSALGRYEAVVAGRVVLDGVRLVRSSFIKLERYSLQSVASEVVGRGKLLAGENRLDEILDTYANDRQLFVDYNLEDARLVLEISIDSPWSISRSPGVG